MRHVTAYLATALSTIFKTILHSLAHVTNMPCTYLGTPLCAALWRHTGAAKRPALTPLTHPGP
jgi:hypothetical protein